MEVILNNITNGNWKEAVRLVKNSNMDIYQVMEAIRNDPFMAKDDDLKLLKVAMGVGYLQTNNDYEH